MQGVRGLLGLRACLGFQGSPIPGLVEERAQGSWGGLLAASLQAPLPFSPKAAPTVKPGSRGCRADEERAGGGVPSRGNVFPGTSPKQS